MTPELAPLEDIVAAASRIGRFVAEVDHAAFMENEEKQSAVFRQIIIIGEAANRLPESFLDAHSEIPWRKMIGMRNRIVHGYDEIGLGHRLAGRGRRDSPAHWSAKTAASKDGGDR